MNKIMRIIGIDPGSRTTGYGIIQVENNQHYYIASGCIRTNEKLLSNRLQHIFQGIETIVNEYRPDEAAIEQVFMHKNANSALKLGQARGAAITAIVNRDMSIPIEEYSAREIKLAVVGYGAAKKLQVQHMVRSLLALKGELQEDAGDGLAVALCHSHTQHGKKVLSSCIQS